MEYIELGQTGLRVSRMGFGGIPIQRTDAEAVCRVFDELIKHGINYVDTARGYTVSEEYIGQAIAGRRDKFILATKSMAVTREAMAADIDRSLKNLGTDYIDLYQIHNPSLANFKKIISEGGALEALLEAKKQGKIGHIGVTAHPTKVFEEALKQPWVETIMFPYNMVESQGEELIRQCREKGIGFIAMKPLAGGAIDEPELALRFIVKNEAVSVVIPGMYTVDEVEGNVNAVENKKPFTEEELARIDKVKKVLGGSFCRRCNYCAPCTVGINIPFMFLLQGYYERYNLKEWAKERYIGSAVRASECIECGKCETRCPYDLPIRSMLKRVTDIFDK
jgi:predicted aldo/keto reductase-like oxidoreductase